MHRATSRPCAASTHRRLAPLIEANRTASPRRRGVTLRLHPREPRNLPNEILSTLQERNQRPSGTLQMVSSAGSSFRCRGTAIAGRIRAARDTPTFDTHSASQCDGDHCFHWSRSRRRRHRGRTGLGFVFAATWSSIHGGAAQRGWGEIKMALVSALAIAIPPTLGLLAGWATYRHLNLTSAAARTIPRRWAGEM